MGGAEDEERGKERNEKEKIRCRMCMGEKVFWECWGRKGMGRKLE